MEAISLAGAAIGVFAKDGIVLAAEKKVTSKLLEQNISDEKLHAFNEYLSPFFFSFPFLSFSPFQKCLLIVLLMVKNNGG